MWKSFKIWWHIQTCTSLESVQCDIPKGIIVVCFHLGHQIIDPEDAINVGMAKWIICALEVGEIYRGVSSSWLIKQLKWGKNI